MEGFEVSIVRMNEVCRALDNFPGRMSSLSSRVNANGLSGMSFSGISQVRSAISVCADRIRTEENSSRALQQALQQIISAYVQTEEHIRGIMPPLSEIGAAVQKGVHDTVNQETPAENTAEEGDLWDTVKDRINALPQGLGEPALALSFVPLI